MSEELENLKRENEILRKRLGHLLQSKFISSFDEMDTKKREYKRDISRADIVLQNNMNLKTNTKSVEVKVRKLCCEGGMEAVVSVTLDG